jgi:hypothetical protein
MMELDVSILTLPDSDWLERISPKGRKAIQSAHHELVKLAATQRTKPYAYGRWFAKIRDTMLAENCGESCAKYCREACVDQQRFYECIRIYEAFEPYVKLLHMFPTTVQIHLSRQNMADVLEDAVEVAKTGAEVTRKWLDERMGVIEDAKAKKAPPPDDDLDDDEEDDAMRFTRGDGEDEDDDDYEPEASIPIERRPEFQDRLLQNALAIDDIEECRTALCKILIEDMQLAKRRLVTFTRDRKVYQGGWYMKAENALDQFSAAIKEWQEGDVIRVGE